MRTTIVVEDAAGSPVGSTAVRVPGESVDVRSAPPVDAGAAPADKGGQTGTEQSSNGAHGTADGTADGGMPPTWLVEAIAQAGGMTAPVSPADIELAGLDAGSAPV